MTESLPAKAYLLAYRTDRRRVRDRHLLGYLVRAAALADLLLRGHIVDVGGAARVTGAGGATGDPVLDDTLTMIRASRPRQWRHWIRKGHLEALRLVQAQLVDAGVLVPEPGRAMGVLPVHRTVVRNRTHRLSLCSAVDGALRVPGDTAAIAPADAVLTALIAAAKLHHVVSREARHHHRSRLDTLASSALPVVRALQVTVRRQRTARVVAIAGPHQ
ncbi:GOLPH3/VPS74 family protein [Nocardia vermiculata]|uniref:GPP34 family phosphoprotein n=1 Tax=Nocardia vermiculata TaxID=257274 RepID=A0A846Y7N9_9NOCA|nr:GPP34 family phosphoprotein [Nocardia vermiculata]NKY53268.1 GPP34 family phosphoprotein [Nocardia vermiculata]